MIWLLIFLITIYILFTYLKSKEKRELNENLRNKEFKRSYIQKIIEQEFQNYLKSDLKVIDGFMKKLVEAEKNNNRKEIKEAKFQIKFFNDEISELKEIKRDLQKDNIIWNHTDFSEDGIIKLKEEISDSFSYAASAALRRIG